MDAPSRTAAPPSLTDRAYDRLRTEILHGELMPGERLRVADLRRRFGLGVTPVREALMRLSTEGLVAAETNRGSRVMTASAAEFADLMAARREIERLCLAQAIAHGDAAWEAEVVAAVHLLSRTALPDTPEDAVAARAWEVQHRRLHAALVSACPSAWLKRFWNTLADQSERFRKLRLLNRQDAKALVRDIDAEHRAIVAAAVERDAAGALRLMDEHLVATERGVAALLAQGQPARNRPG